MRPRPAGTFPYGPVVLLSLLAIASGGYLWLTHGFEIVWDLSVAGFTCF